MLYLAMAGGAFYRKSLNVFPGDGSCHERERKAPPLTFFHSLPRSRHVVTDARLVATPGGKVMAASFSSGSP